MITHTPAKPSVANRKRSTATAVKSDPSRAMTAITAGTTKIVNSRWRNAIANTTPKTHARRRGAQSSSTYRNGSTLAPSVWSRRLAGATGGVRNGNAAMKASAGRIRVDRASQLTSKTATAALIRTNGRRSMAKVGPPTRKKGAAIHACTPSM